MLDRRLQLAAMKYKVELQYVGTRYSGWQIQKDRSSIQGVLKEAVRTLTGEEVSVVGAGRTDAGVHAVQQVAHFRLSEEMAPARLHQSLNGLLPWDIRVTRLIQTHARFHAQKDAKRKRYEYRIFNGPTLPPFLSGYVLQVRPPLDAGAMQDAAERISGRRDFSAFAASSTRVKSRVRTVQLSQIVRKGPRIHYRIEADGFLHHMVRNIAGTLLQIGLGKRSPSEIGAILKRKDRRLAGPTAPAQALFLMRVWYREPVRKRSSPPPV